MSMRANEPAYPVEIEVASREPLVLQEVQTGDGRYMAHGLTLREHFAGLAMQGLLAQTPNKVSAAEIARQAAICADALLAALAKATP